MESPGTRQGYDGMVGNGVGPSGIVRLARGDRAESSGSLSGSLTDQARDVPGTPYDQQQQQRQQQYQQQEGADTDKDTCGLAKKQSLDTKLSAALTAAHQSYNLGRYKDAQSLCEAVYREGAYRTDNLLLLGAVHFQLRNLSECILYNQQCIRIDPHFAEAYSNLGNALKELGDVAGAVQFYLKAVKLKPRFCDAYNNLASAYMQLGQTQEAIETYQMALVLNRGLVDAHSNLGNLYKAQGMLSEAKRCYLEAIRIKPSFSIAWSNLAGIFKEEGNLTTAVAYYREAIRLCPEFADAHSNLGNVLKERGLIHDAMQCYQTAIKLRPDFAIAFGNLASCYYDSGCQDLAVRTFRYAIQLEPNFPDAYNNLGNALRESGQLEEAINCYRTTLRLKADHPHAYNNLGNAMKDKGLIKEAIHCYVTAVRLMPKFAAVHSNLGSVLKEQGRLGHALAHYQEAIAIDPTFADAYSNMGNAYKDMGRLQDAIKCYSAAIDIKPTFADAYSNLASAYKEGGDVVQAIACYRKALSLRPDFPDAFANLVHSLVFVCDWSNRDKDFATLRSMLATQMATDNVLPSVQPFHAMAYPLSLAEMQQISCKYAERVKMNVALLEMPAFRFHRKAKGARVRVGYVSSDLGNHPLSHLMQSVFGMHDRSRFEVKCYALSAKDDSIWRRKIEGDSEHFCDVSALQNGDVARLIHADGIDILINLNGYTKGARNEIFALQPAPVQVSYLGFCGTLGADYMQYMIADKTLVPPESRLFYTEKILYMPHTYFVNDHKQSARYVLDRTLLPIRAAYGVPEDRFVLCNFNQLYKMDPAIFSTWMAVLRRVPNAVLWLLRFPPAGEGNIRAEARKRGVRDEQLHFTDVASKEEHIKRGYLADLFLDTPSCNAHTTGCDILWSGTPMLTMAGSKMATRVAPSLLKAAGADELIVDSLEDYEELAVSLATDPERLFEIRSRLEEGRHSCPLFDTQRWVRNMEAGLMMTYERFQAGLQPEHLEVDDVPGGDITGNPTPLGEGNAFALSSVAAGGSDEIGGAGSAAEVDGTCAAGANLPDAAPRFVGDSAAAPFIVPLHVASGSVDGSTDTPPLLQPPFQLDPVGVAGTGNTAYACAEGSSSRDPLEIAPLKAPSSSSDMVQTATGSAGSGHTAVDAEHSTGEAHDRFDPADPIAKAHVGGDGDASDGAGVSAGAVEATANDGGGDERMTVPSVKGRPIDADQLLCSGGAAVGMDNAAAQDYQMQQEYQQRSCRSVAGRAADADAIFTGQSEEGSIFDGVSGRRVTAEARNGSRGIEQEGAEEEQENEGRVKRKKRAIDQDDLA